MLLSVSAGIIATVHVNVLTQPGMVLAGWARWLYNAQTYYITRGQSWTERQDPLLFQTRRYHVSEWLLKPILTCVYCVGGQAGFWLAVYYQVSYCTTFSVMFCPIVAVLSVWMAGLFQCIQQRYFPF